MMKTKTIIYQVLLCVLFIGKVWAQDPPMQLYAELEDETKVADDGLHFGVKAQFGPRISPYGDCIDVVNGYAFVVWYKGGMEDRSVMLSRKNLKVANSDWVTIQFPHKHVGFRNNETLGDSHNTIAIGISTFDNKVHLIYDMHAYSASTHPNDFFNYSVSSVNGAFVPDADFKLSLFQNSNTTNAKLNYLKQGEDYGLLTYPEIHRAPDGTLVVSYRVGGAGNGNQLLAYYNQDGWTNNWVLSKGRTSSPTYSMYGHSKFQFGKYYTGFSIRDYQSTKYDLNQGLYFTYTDTAPTGSNSVWRDINGAPITIPFASDVENLKVGMPQDDYSNSTFPRTPSNPSFVVTESGAVHFLTRVDNVNTHYYKKADDAQFSSNSGSPVPNSATRGAMFSYLDHVFVMEIISGKFAIKTAKEGTNDWRITYEEGIADLSYKYFESYVDGDKLYVFLMELGNLESLALYLKVFTLTEREEGTEPIEIPNFSIEAENFSSGSGIYSVDANSNASAGSYINPFTGDASLTYTINLDNYASATPGIYDLKIVASNANRTDSTMEIIVNGDATVVPITRTFDYDVFEKSTLKNITLVAGVNTIVMNQKLAFSSRPDVLEFHQKSPLSIDEFSKSEVVIYPNPSNGVFNIKTNVENPNYTLINIQGQVLERGIIKQNILNLSSYSKGIYLLELRSDKSRLMKKIVIK